MPTIWSMVRWEPWTLPFPHVTLWDLRPVSFTQGSTAFFMSSNIDFIEVSNVSKMVENGFGDLPGHVSDHVDIRGSFDLGFGMEDLEA